MKKLIFLLLSVSPSWLFAQSFDYPNTRKSPFYDTIQHTVIADDYQWLEQTKSGEVKNWVKEQNKFTNRYLQKNTDLSFVEKGIADFAYVSYNLGDKQGKYYFRLRYNDISGTPALYFQEKLNDYPDLLVDPVNISTKDRIDILNYVLSKDEKYLAYQYNRNGTDWREIRIADIKRRKDMAEVLTDVKFSGIDWLGNGFFYSRYKRTNDPYAAAEGQQIWYHTIGTAQDEDSLVFAGRTNPVKQLSIDITYDERYMIIYETNEENESSNIYIRDLRSPLAHYPLFFSGPTAEMRIIGVHNDSLIALTHYKANNGFIVLFSPEKPGNWVQRVAEMEDGIIVEAKAYKKGIITVIQSDLAEFMIIYDWEGSIKKVLPFTPGYSVSMSISSADEKKMLFYFYSFTLPPVVFELNLETFEYKKTVDKTLISYDYTKFEYEKVNYPSRDGTMVPMLLVYKKEMKRNGNNPLLLKSYGGFGNISRASFDPGLVYFLDNGGVFAYAYIRGEGVNGTKWAQAGKGIHKQRSFDDFIAAAEYLIKNNYTNPSRLAITGASNGGLVIGAVITQRPELFRAAIPRVGVLDMLHFEKETVGVFHKDEYGTISDSTLFKNLYAYSPLHNLNASKKYPSLLIITAENDDRVPPYHSYKFAAKLQQLGKQNPVLLRVEEKAGHYGADTWEGKIKESAEIYAFLLHELKGEK